MKDESVKAYSYRISQASPTQLIVIMYDMAAEYLTDALNTADDELTEYRYNIKLARRVIDRLSYSLDMKYDVAKELHTLYGIMTRYLIRTSVTRDDKLVGTVISMLGKLRKSFYEISINDTTGPVMKNTQQVYAGLTYSNAGGSNEYSDDPVANRGYIV